MTADSAPQVLAGQVRAGQVLAGHVRAGRKPDEVDERLRDSEARFRAFVTATFDVVYRMSPDWSEMRELHGRGFLADMVEPREDWLNSYVAGEDRPEVESAIRRAIDTRTMFQLEHRVRRADGTLAWTFSRAVPMIDAQGEIVEWLGAARDITARKEAEATLRESEERKRLLLQLAEARQSFLLRLSDALRPMGNPVEIERTVTRMLGEHLEASRVFYLLVDDDGDTATVSGDYKHGVSSRVGRFSLSAFSSYAVGEWRAGRIARSSDVDSDPRYEEAERKAYASVSTRAGFGVPLIKEGRLVAVLGVNQAVPRHWTDHDVDLASEVAERTWAAVERARAEATLRESQARLAAVFDVLPVGVGVFDARGALLLSNQGMRRFVPTRVMPSQDEAQRSRWRAWHPDGRPVEPQEFPGARALRGGRAVPGIEMLHTDDDGLETWTSVSAVPLNDREGCTAGAVIVIAVIDALKRAAEALRESETRQAFLLRLSDALRPLGDPHQTQQVAMRALCEELGVSRASYYEVGDDQEHLLVGQTYSAVDGPSRTPHLRFSSLGFLLSAYQAGETLVFDDIANDARFDEPTRAMIVAERGAHATVGVPLVKEGRLIAMVGVHRSAPHAWTPYEVAMLQETAERTWAAVERTRAEAALRDSEARYRNLFQTMRQGYVEREFIRDEHGQVVDFRLLEANPQYERLSGVPREHAIGRTSRDVAPDMQQSWIDIIERIVRTGKPERFEHPVVGWDRWYEVHVYPRGHDRFAALYDDITERKRAEAALRESEERFRALFAASPVPFMVLAPNPPDFTITAANDAYFAATLTTPQTLIGRRLFDVFPDDPGRPGQLGSDALAASLARVLLTRRTDAMERVRYDIITPSGGFEPHWWLAINAPLIDTKGNITAIIHQVDRQTELHLAEQARQRAQDALRESEERQRLLIELVPALLWWADPAGAAITITEGWRSYTGQSDADTQGFEWLDVIHPEDRAETEAAFAAAFASGKPLERQQRIREKGNGYRWHLVRHVPVRNQRGGIERWFGAATDIQELRELQERQQVLVAELQHRTRNLLGVIRATADKTARASGNLAEFREAFSDRLNALARVQGLLSRLREHDRVTFDELIGSEMAALDGAAARVTLDGPAGVRLRSSWVQTLAMALHELATNAVKYGALGQPQAHLAISWTLEQGEGNGRPWLHVDWRETGVAMPPAGSRPGGSGQGRLLIERALPHQLGARTTYVLGPDGVHCTIAIPVSSTPARQDDEHG